MKPLLRRLEKLERARRPVVDEWGVTLRERMERSLQRVREAGLTPTPAPAWAVERLRSSVLGLQPPGR